MVDNPAEYITQLQTEARTARVALSLAQSRIEELELALVHSDSIRAAMVQSAVEASDILTKSLARLEHQQPIIDAAVEYFEADGRGETHINLMRATEPEICRRETSS
jgi:hypothetical protein